MSIAYAIAHPVAYQIIAISSDGLGWFDDQTEYIGEQ
jgi:hypothetical protein